MTMGNPKPHASLSSTLLARKGTARPAMRPQGFGGFGAIPTAADDLGWNDMGEQETVPVSPVLVLREELTAAIADEPRPRVSVATATRIRRETNTEHSTKSGSHARSAFTLRLDTDRHLKLRLASALNHRSAQLIVTEALDAFLANQPDVEALLKQLPAGTKKGS